MCGHQVVEVGHVHEFTLPQIALNLGRARTSFPFSHIQHGVHQKMFAFLAIPVRKCLDCNVQPSCWKISPFCSLLRKSRFLVLSVKASEPSFFQSVYPCHLTLSISLSPLVMVGEPLPSPYILREDCTLCLRASLEALLCKQPTCNARDIGDMGSISESGKSPGEGRGYPLHYSCLENSMDRRAWWAMGLQSWMQLSDLACICWPPLWCERIDLGRGCEESPLWFLVLSH